MDTKVNYVDLINLIAAIQGMLLQSLNDQNAPLIKMLGGECSKMHTQANAGLISNGSSGTSGSSGA